MVVRADGEKKVLKKEQVQQASGLSIRSIEERLKVFNKGQFQQGKWIKKNCTHICFNFIKRIFTPGEPAQVREMRGYEQPHIPQRGQRAAQSQSQVMRTSF